MGELMLCLSITGFDVEPHLVTEILDIEPTSTNRAGEMLRSGRPARTSAWHLALDENAPFTTGAKHSELLQALLARLADKHANFARLRKEAKPRDVTIYGGLYVGGQEQLGIWLEPEQMALLAACGIGWGLDVFVAEEPATSSAAS
jgi:hypothetical protein